MEWRNSLVGVLSLVLVAWMYHHFGELTTRHDIGNSQRCSAPA